MVQGHEKHHNLLQALQTNHRVGQTQQKQRCKEPVNCSAREHGDQDEFPVLAGGSENHMQLVRKILTNVFNVEWKDQRWSSHSGGHNGGEAA